MQSSLHVCIGLRGEHETRVKSFFWKRMTNVFPFSFRLLLLFSSPSWSLARSKIKKRNTFVIYYIRLWNQFERFQPFNYTETETRKEN